MTRGTALCADTWLRSDRQISESFRGSQQALRSEAARW